MEALRGDRTAQEIAARHQVHPNQVSTWKRQALDGLVQVFSNGGEAAVREHEAEVSGDMENCPLGDTRNCPLVT